MRPWAAAALALLILATPVAAQDPASGDWQHGTTVTAFGGGSNALSDFDIAAGLALGWEVTPRVTIEGRGMWFNGSTGSSAFAAVLGPRFPLRPAHRLNPFVSAGVGMFRASFTSGATEIPEFYRRQMDPDGPQIGTFDDFMYTFGGGLDLFLNNHFALRPEWSLMLVTDGSETRGVQVYGVTLAYHFEDHPPGGSRAPTGRGLRR